ncbi:ATP-dependent dethiobiotin synthetase BioD [Micromonospora echinofusca]|uniref:AAA family ATPase n=1 Tax=Micromonospora echinofusca TaxID=47858 RepID=A0ABS3VNE8_MICEH|nr:dethiobiotin synthase [Micromonospora echinofusca]MBO4206063.1 AAA family ATPase [Micromonospora echinofusca]
MTTPPGSGDHAAHQPDVLVVVAGTDTEVGKTWTTADVARRLRRAGLSVAARKPVQSHEPDAVDTDATVLAQATGEAATAVCPPHRDFAVPMAPPMAAASLGLPPFGVADLVDELAWPPGCDVGFVESAGGVRSPIAADGDTVDLVRAVRPDLVVLVAHAGLGVINALRLCAAALDPVRPVVLLNRFDAEQDLHQRNLEWSREVDGFEVVTSPQELTGLIQRRLTDQLTSRRLTGDLRHSAEVAGGESATVAPG